MRRTREIVGLPILDVQTGEQVGWVKDVVFDSKEETVAGLILEGAHIFHSGQGITRRAIVAVGKDALTINDSQLTELHGVYWSQKVGNKVFTRGGEAQGTIEDVFLDDVAMHIVGYEVSDGLFADLFYGRGAIFQNHVMVDGKDVLIVDDRVSPWDEQYKGGSLS